MRTCWGVVMRGGGAVELAGIMLPWRFCFFWVAGLPAMTGSSDDVAGGGCCAAGGGALLLLLLFAAAGAAASSITQEKT